MRQGEPLRYLDQFVERYDPEVGLVLPEQVAALVQLEAGRSTEDPGELWRRSLAALLRERGAPRLRTLILGDWTEQAPDLHDICFESGAVAPLLRRGPVRLAALERLHVGGFARAEVGGYCLGVGAGLTCLPALVRLQLVGERGWDLLPPAGHPRLRELIVAVEEHDDDVLAVLLSAPFPALERIDLRCEDPGIDAALVDGSLVAALAGGQLPALGWLTLRGVSGAEAVAGLGAGDALARLHTLALTDAPGLTDAALAGLLAAPWLPRLTRLELRGTGVSSALARQFGERGPVVVTD